MKDLFPVSFCTSLAVFFGNQRSSILCESFRAFNEAAPGTFYFSPSISIYDLNEAAKEILIIGCNSESNFHWFIKANFLKSSRNLLCPEILKFFQSFFAQFAGYITAAP